MGRPPCCDKLGVKKGPWTPEEDTLLISFVDDNGPGNWRAVPTKTGLKRCSKSCRLRWTNYLRPGIKRGTFTDQEEKMIVQLQALLGNKWAAIASYLPERTDNDIKNYWNTHLKKKLKRLESGSGQDPTRVVGCPSNNPNPRGQWERRLQCDDVKSAKQALHDALTVENNEPCSNSIINYASSTENIARLLKDWVKNTPKFEESSSSSSKLPQDLFGEGKNGNVELSEAFEALFGFESNNNKNICDDHFSRSTSPSGEARPDPTEQLAPLSVLENWLLGDQGNKDCLANFSFDEEDPNLF